MPPETVWLNTTDYTPFELILFGIGCLGWVVSYVAILLRVRRNQFLEIPAGAVVANVAWEYLWGFTFTTSMGMVFAWGYRIWFFLDLFIVYMLFKYGWKQADTPVLTRVFNAASAFGIACWLAALYYFIAGGYDTSYGAISGYILNVMMSALYLVLIAKQSANPQFFSEVVAWSKMLGTALLSVFNYMVRPDDYLLMTLYVATFVLDVVYIVAVRTLNGSAAPVRVPRAAIG
jgi:hypothetical protein